VVAGTAMSSTAILKLAESGFTEAQVRALAEFFDSQMATKNDIAELKVELKYDIEKIRADLEMKIAGLDVKIADATADTIEWVAGLMVAQGAAIVALVKFLPGVHS
jgi:hypothetical protein